MNHGLDTDTHVYFYEQEYYVLSNFSAFRLNWRGKVFDTSEHAYHWEKFTHLAGASTRDAILSAPSAHDAYRIAQSNAALVHSDWLAVRVGVMRRILRAKVDQHPYVRKKLLETGDRVLVENSWRDGYWGHGPDGTGRNQLGLIWMSIRSELQRDMAGPPLFASAPAGGTPNPRGTDDWLTTHGVLVDHDSGDAG